MDVISEKPNMLRCSDVRCWICMSKMNLNLENSFINQLWCLRPAFLYVETTIRLLQLIMKNEWTLNTLFEYLLNLKDSEDLRRDGTRFRIILDRANMELIFTSETRKTVISTRNERKQSEQTIFFLVFDPALTLIVAKKWFSFVFSEHHEH